MTKPDLSKCHCDKPGWCPIFKKEMGTDPPNWQWCQDAPKETRERYVEASKGNKLNTLRRAMKNSQVEIISFYDEVPPPQSKYAVCVIPANELATNLLSVTRKNIQEYAEKCGADYVELQGDQHPDWPMANKYRLHGVTSKYEKTVYLDCDVFVRKNAPNLFEETPDDKISAYDEWEVWEDKNDTAWIQKQQEVIVYKIINKDQQALILKNGQFTASRMINGGVMVIPNALADYYKQPEAPYPRHWCFDQNHLSVTLPENKFHPLDVRYNLEYVDPRFFKQYEDSYFIHVNNLKNDEQLRVNILHALVEGNKLIDIEHYESVLTLGYLSGKESIRSGYEIPLIETSSLDIKDELPEKRSDYAVCVINTGDYTERQLSITRDKIVEYAKKCGADYIELTGDKVPEYPMYNKYRLSNVTAAYEKTLYLDCDIVIQDHAPNIFLETPDNQISAHCEFNYLGDPKLQEIIDQEADFIRSYLGLLEDLPKRHINGGVLVIPNALRARYQLPDNEKIPLLWCFDQIMLGFALADEDLYELGNKWNCSFKHTTFKEYGEYAYFLHLNNPQSTRIPTLNWFKNKKWDGLYTAFGCVPTKECAHHRSGWNQICMQLLDENSDEGIYIDCFLENAFAWKHDWYKVTGHIPFVMPWVGFFHNPPVYPEHFLEIIPERTRFGLLDDILESYEFKTSLEQCQALFTLSSYLADYLREKTGVPTLSFKHPISDFDFLKWDADRAAQKREVSMIGYWYRKFENFIRMNTTYQKSFLGGNKEQLMWYLNHECRVSDIPFNAENYKIYPPLTATEYDKQLSENVVFLDFWDTACNTSLLDCIARHTPVVIVKHPAVVEYLGEDYPLYFERVSQANAIMDDFNLIVRGHEYLKNMDKSDLTEEYFFDKLRNWHDHIQR